MTDLKHIVLVWNQEDLNPLTIEVMKEVGIDVSGQKSKGVDVYLGKMLFQYLITVCDDAEKNCPTTWPGISKRMHWSFEDPAKFEGTEEQKLAKFREVRDLIENKIKSMGSRTIVMFVIGLLVTAVSDRRLFFSLYYIQNYEYR